MAMLRARRMTVSSSFFGDLVVIQNDLGFAERIG
jgi:hypothetical protein